MKDTTTSDEGMDACYKQPFASLPLSHLLLSNLKILGFEYMTSIQAQSLPLMLKGNDVIACSNTGSGKTAAFGLSILNNLNVENYRVQTLVLCPTRELAEQVCQAIRSLARLMPNVKILNLSGGIPIKSQLDSLRHGAHIIVGTPGRVLKHLNKQSLPLTNLRSLILDEADRMLDMGFLDDLKTIIATCPTTRQTLLFSATYPSEIKKISQEFMIDPQEVSINLKHSQQEIMQVFYEVNNQDEKFSLLKALLLHHKPSSTLIFCNTKQQTVQLTKLLKKEGFSASAINGDIEQADRDLALVQFANQSCSILVATDVAARGLDIKELPAVINYELAFEHDAHIHRVGRTGRAGNTGLALSLTTPGDARRVCTIEDNLDCPLIWGEMSALSYSDSFIYKPRMVTLYLGAGRKDKIRPGDILGALIKDAQLPSNVIGKINIADRHSYIAIHREYSIETCQYFENGKIKGRYVNVRIL